MNKLDISQTYKGITALLSYLEKKKTKTDRKQLLSSEDNFIYMTIGFKRTLKGKSKPIRIPLKHSLYTKEDSELCLITKDGVDLKTELEHDPIEKITQIYTLNELRNECSTYKDQRSLANSYSLFLSDNRILPLLPRVIGKTFFVRKKHPVPVNLSKKSSIRNELIRARDSTYLYIPNGPCSMLKVGRTSWPVSNIVENISEIIDPVVKHLPQKWKSVQSISVKSIDSLSLSIFNSIPQNKKLLI